MFRTRSIGRVASAVGILASVVVIGLSTTASAALPGWTPPPSPDQLAGPAQAPAGVGVLAVRPVSVPETHFVTVTPCRIVDTRSAGGILRSGTARTFYVAGTAGFPGQGGRSGGCGVPIGAASVAVNVTTTQTGGSGYLVGYAAGTPQPTSSFISFALGVNTTANPILPLAQTTGPQLTIKAQSNNTHVVVDVTGYYAFQIEGLIHTKGGAGSIISGSPRILAVTNQGPGVAAVTLDRDVTNCTPLVTSYFKAGVYANAVGFSANTVTVYTWYVDPSTHNAIPFDNYAYLTVNC